MLRAVGYVRNNSEVKGLFARVNIKIMIVSKPDCHIPTKDSRFVLSR